MKHILTGGPCTGKTSVLEELARRGHRTVPESARDLIAHEQAKAQANPQYTGILPWTDMVAFEEQLMYRQLGAEKTSADFLDRALPDILAYCKVASIQPPKGLHNHIARAEYGYVFVFDRLPYAQDGERKEDDDLGQRIHDTLIETYKSLRMPVVYVPVFPGTKEESIRARADYVLNHISYRMQRAG